MTNVARAVVTIFLLQSLAGCGENGLKKVIVSGEVTYQGEPVENGDVLFYPMEGTSGPVSGASIKDGRYVAEGKGGVPVGKHRIKVRAFRAGKPKVNLSAEEAELEEFDGGGTTHEQYLPEKFNNNSELEVVIESGSRRAVHDIHLVD